MTGTIVPPGNVGAIAGGELTLSSRRFVNDGLFTCDLVESDWYHGTIPGDNVYTLNGINVGTVSVSATNPFGGRASANGTLAKHADTLTLPPLRWQDTIGGELSGHILLPDGVTLAGAGVEVRADGPVQDVTVRTDAEGKYGFAPILPAGLYTLTVSDSVTGGRARERFYLHVGPPVTRDIRLKGRGSVKVDVVDDTLGEALPVENAVVKLQEVDYPNRSFEAVLRPGSQGTTTFEGIYEGRVGITVRDAYGRGGTASGQITAPGEAITIKVEVTDTGTVKGRFFMPDADRTPIPFASVTLRRNGQVVSQQTTTSTDPVGSFQFDYVPTGHVQVELEDPLTRRTGTAEGELSDGQELYLDVTALGLGEVRGQVVQSRAGKEPQPVPLAEVQIASGAFSATTYSDGQGFYSMDGVPEGTVTVEAFVRSGRAKFFPGSTGGLLEGEDGQLALDVRLQDTGIVTGQVRGRDGQGLEGVAQVTLTISGSPTSGWKQTVPTSDDDETSGKARFRFEDVPTGNGSLSADVVGSADGGKAGPFTVPSGTVDVPIDLQGLGTLRVLALDADGKPTSGSIDVEIGSGTFRNHYSQPITGEASFTNVFAGMATVNLKTHPGDFDLYGADSKEIVPGTTLTTPTDIMVTAQPGGTVSGTVVVGDAPVGGAEVSLLPLSDTGQQSTWPVVKHWTPSPSTGESTGAFEFKGVPYGSFRVSVYEPVSKSSSVPVVATLAGPSLSLGALQLDGAPPQIAFLEPQGGSSRRALGGPILLSLSDEGSGIDPTSLRVSYPNGYVQKLTPADGTASGQLATSALVIGSNHLRARVADLVGQAAETAIDFTILGARLSGVVKRGDDPVQATVKIGSLYTSQTDAQGGFERDGLKPGTYSVSAIDPVSALTKVVSVTLADGEEREDLEIVLPTFRPIAGHVHAHGQPDVPVGGVTVKCVTSNCSGRSAVTSADGSFDLGAFTAGTYTLEATAPDTDRGRASFTVNTDDPTPPSPVIELNGVGSVTVTVLKGEVPAQGASVSFTSDAPFVPNQYSGKTGADGTVSFDRVLMGSFKVHATRDDLVGDSDTVTLATADVPLPVTVALQDVTPPKVVAVAPPNQAIQVPTDTTIRTTFDEPLSVPPTFTLKAASATVSGTTELETPTVAVFRPSSVLVANQSYSVAVSAARDLSGIAQTATWYSGFKTTDSTPPVVQRVAPDLVNGTPGLVDGWTASATPRIRVYINDGANGSGLDLASATMTLDGTPVPAVASNELTYTPPTPLADGVHVMVATIKDRAGNLGSLTSSFGVDTAAPAAAQITSPAGSQVVKTPLSVTATAADATAGIHTIKIFVDGSSTASATLSAPDFSGTVSGMADGPHTLTARATDRANNQGPVGTGVTVLVDNNPLTVQFNSPANGTAVHGTLHLKATTSEPVTSVTFGIPYQSSTVTPAQPNQLVFETDFALTAADASPAMPIRVDALGLQSEAASASRTVVVDWTPPAAPDTSKITAEVSDGGVAVVNGDRGSVEGYATVEMTNISRDPQVTSTTKAAGDGLFRGTVPGALDDVLSLRAVDSVGNASDAVTVTVEHRTTKQGIPLTGMLLWLDAAEGVEINPDAQPGEPYFRWKDQTERTDPSESNDAYQTDAGAVPTLSPSAANGLPGLSFDGGDAVLFTSPLAHVRTVFWVLRSAETTATPSGYRSMLGDDSWTGWRGGYGHPGAMFGSSSATIKSGQLWVNGEPVQADTTAEADDAVRRLARDDCERAGRSLRCGLLRRPLAG